MEDIEKHTIKKHDVFEKASFFCVEYFIVYVSSNQNEEHNVLLKATFFLLIH
jgi:hypothetical protein